VETKFVFGFNRCSYNVAATNTYQIAGEKTIKMYILASAVLQLLIVTFFEVKKTQQMGNLMMAQISASKASGLKKER